MQMVLSGTLGRVLLWWNHLRLQLPFWILLEFLAWTKVVPAHVDLHIPLKMHILVPWSKTMLDTSYFFLTAEYSDYAEGGCDFKA
jgi:hypothetical protein